MLMLVAASEFEESMRMLLTLNGVAFNFGGSKRLSRTLAEVIGWRRDVRPEN